MKESHGNNVIAFPDTQPPSRGEMVLMNANLLQVFAKIENDTTHQVALEIIKYWQQIDLQNISENLGISIFCVRRAIIELEKLGLLSHQNHRYKLTISLGHL
jgi:hypothetical protein